MVWLSFWAVVYTQLSFRTVPLNGERSFNSPDETANFYFSRRIAAGDLIAAPQVPGNLAGGIVHPRSMAVLQGKLVPLSFLGMPVWYGLAGRLAGPWIIIFLTPLFAALGGWAFFRICNDVFGRRVAFAAALLLPLLPPWWYYSARSMFHNVAFFSLTLCSFAAVLAVHRHGRTFIAFFGGLSLGVALSLRLVEGVWILPLMLLAFIFCPRRYKRAWVWVAAGTVLAGLPVLFHQAATYGHFWQTGYLLPPAGSAVGSGGASRTWQDFFPYGIHPRRAASNAGHFLFGMLPWIFWPAILGILIQVLRWRELNNHRRFYLVAFLAVSLFSLGYYGSAALQDNLDPQAVTLGVSYVRYWIPIYVAVLPFAVIGVQWVVKRFHSRFTRRLISMLLFGLASWLSVRATFYEPSEGLRSVASAINAGYTKRSQVAAVVEPDAVIVAERSDKIFFPTYAVVGTLLDPAVQQNLPDVVAVRPVYYYSFLGGGDIETLQKNLQRYGLSLTEVMRMNQPPAAPEQLYRVTVQSNPNLISPILKHPL